METRILKSSVLCAMTQRKSNLVSLWWVREGFLEEAASKLT